jgi:hypothetical protein
MQPQKRKDEEKNFWPQMKGGCTQMESMQSSDCIGVHLIFIRGKNCI